MTNSVVVPDTARDVLAFARSCRAEADRAEAELLQAAVAWAAMHSTDSLPDAATIWISQWGDTGVPVAGPGAPLVAEFCVAEFAAAIGLSPDAGGHLLGEAVELRYRLPRLWAHVVAGDLVAWKARRIARETLFLAPEAAAFVDTHVADFAHRVGPAMLQRLVDDAVNRFMPQEAAERAARAADERCFDIHTGDADITGVAPVSGVLDLADALDLEAAVSEGARQLRDLGSDASLDVRRAQAVGELARRQLAFGFDEDTVGTDGFDTFGGRVVGEANVSRPTQPPNGTDAADGDAFGGRVAGEARVSRPSRPEKPTRQVVLYVHLSEAALRGTGDGIGRVENTRSPITAEQVREWCRATHTEVVVKPVIDLQERVQVGAWEVPDRLSERSALTDHTCVFPWCTRPARRCDSDHIVPHACGGPTASDNLAPLCRRHHRLKTHGGWTYTRVEAATYLWRSPHGHQYLRDPGGTLDLSPD